MCEQLFQSYYVERSGQDSNLRPLGCRFDTVTTTTPGYATVTKAAFVNVFNVSFVALITNLVSKKAADAVMLFIPYIMQLTAILKAVRFPIRLL